MRHTVRNSTQRIPKYIKNNYPLIDAKITRAQCIEYLQSHYPQINWNDAKSACWFCPFNKRKVLLQLTNKQKQEMITLEENCRIPSWKFKSKPIKMYLHKDCHTLDEYEDDITCDSGHCFQ